MAWRVYRAVLHKSNIWRVLVCCDLCCCRTDNKPFVQGKITIYVLALFCAIDSSMVSGM